MGLGLQLGVAAAGGLVKPDNIVPELLWWKLNEGSGTDVTAEVGPDGTWTTDAYWGDGVVDGGAAHGGGTHTITTNSDINFGTDELTFCFWFKTSAYITQYIVKVASDLSTTDTAFDFYMTATQALVRVRSYIETAYAATTYKFPLPPLDSWNHIAVNWQYNGGGDGKGLAKYWLNGVEQSSLEEPTRNKDAASNGNFATDSLVTGAIRNAESDDYRLYSGTLTDEQVAAIVANPA